MRIQCSKPALAAFLSCSFFISRAGESIQPDPGTWTGDWGSPKVFIENKGQFPALGAKDANVLYAYDDNTILIYFKKDGFSYSLLHADVKEEKEEGEQERFKNEKQWYKHEQEEHKIDFKRDDIYIKWENSNPNTEVVAEGLVEDYYNYAIKDDDHTQHSIDHCRAFTKLTYKNIYSGIDLEFVFHPQGGIKYSFIVHPGADAAQIRMDYSGMNGLSKNKDGDMLIKTIFGNIVDHAPQTFYQDQPSAVIPSAFERNNDQVYFLLNAYDQNRTIVIDPWQATSGLGFGTTNKIWECEHDNASNSYFWGGAFPKVLLKKFNNAGTLQWTYTSPWDTSGFWIGTFITDNNGVSYTTGGSNGEISKVSAAGTQVWYNNPNGVFGPLFEYWHLSFNCDQTTLIVGGMRAPNPFSINNYRGATITINMGSGAVTGFTPVGYVAGFNIKEVRSICTCPTGGYYFLTLDSIGYVSSTNVLVWKNTSTLNFSYGNPSYSVKGNMGMSAIRANASFIYTQNGSQIQKRSIANGAIVGTAPIPGGISATFLGTFTFGNSGLDIDSCGNVYVGSGNQIVKYDANLVQLSTQATPGVVYDVSVSKTGQVVACGNGFIGTYAMGACNPMQIICLSSVLSASATSTNILCNGQCTGTATATAINGTPSYTYNWTPSGGTNANATGLCAGSYTCTVTDNVGATATTTVTITQPATAISSSVNPTNASCNGGTNGSATVTASGGTGTLTYSWSAPGGTNATITGLGAGTYTCTITDANGCTHIQTVTITAPTAITASATSTPTGCSGNTGTATVTASGGTGILTYSWAPSGGTNANATGLGSGTYTVYITDANGCTQTATTAVSGTGGPTVSLQSQTNVLCNGNATGAGTVTVSGGTSPYTYLWSPNGGTSATGTGLSAGTYTCLVTDANGCTQTQTVTITQPTAISGSTVTTASSCGNNNGTATVTASGGTGILTYSWVPTGGTNVLATGLGAGSYTVYVTDANGCTQTITATVSNSNGPAVVLQSQTNVLCNGGGNGSATVTVTGGTSPYTYAWSPSGGTNATASGLSAGTYTVTITDANGCTGVQTVTITEPTAISGTTSSTTTACNSSSGTATVNTSGGTAPYSYSWSASAQTTVTATGLGAGTYIVYITDANGCTQTATVSVAQGNAPTASLQSQTNISCNGNTNGVATVTVTGGTSPYTYAWSPSGGTNASATGLSAGTYTCTVTDANGCTSVTTLTIIQPAAIALTASSVPACGLTNGSASSNVSGGTAPYTYSWSPSGGTNSSAGGLSAGTYTCTVTDANGCTQTVTVAVITNAFPIADAGIDVTISIGNNTVLNATGGGTYSWTTGETTSSITVAPTTSTSYCVFVTNAAGCVDSACVTVNVDVDCGELFIPNAFSPNADGENDVLKIFGGCIKDLQFAIYDRWGEKVFETTDPTDVWDGTYKGKMMNTAVFVYRLEVVLLTGESISRKGNISLIR